MKIAKKYIFIGHVQGVGFRMTVASIANSLEVFGYVKNLTNGTVELHVEAEKIEIENFRKKIEEEMTSHISKIEVLNTKIQNFKDFSIKK